MTQRDRASDHGLYWVGQEPAQASHRQNTAWIRRVAGIWDTSRALKMWKNMASWEIVTRDSTWGPIQAEKELNTRFR